MTSLSEYRDIRHRAIAIYRPDGGYDLSKGEMNPQVVKKFASMTRIGGTAWEPFSNPDGRNIAVFERVAASLIAFSLKSEHQDVIIKNSTQFGPGMTVDSILFHPPYFGSCPLSQEAGELSLVNEESEWKILMQRAADIAMDSLHTEGWLLAVGRRYRHNGKEIKLDEWFVEAFSRLEVVEVWTSEPDVAILMRFPL